MNLNQLQYFVCLAHREHYTKAAEELNISQPSLSHAIASLERELGAKLFEKQGRNIVLTKYGRIFCEYAEESLRMLDAGVKEVKTVTGQTEGRIDLGYIYTLGSSFIPVLVNDFLRAHEELNVRFRFTVGNTSRVIEGIKEGAFDIGFCSMAEREQGIRFTPVGTENLVVVVPKGHPLAAEPSVDLERVAAYPQICYTENSGLRPVIDRMFARIKAEPAIAYEIEEDGSMAGLVAQGFGVAVMPEIPILGQLGVEVIPIRDQYEKRYVYMAESAEHYQSPAVVRFADYVKRYGSRLVPSF